MVQVRVVRKGVDFNQIARELEIDIQDLKKQTLMGAADSLIAKSPVDSGTYVKNHSIGLRSGSFAATGLRSDSAPRKSRGDAVDEGAAKSTGRQLLAEDIEQVDLTSESFVIRNGMIYADKVESGWAQRPGYAVYAQTVRELPSIIQRVAQSIAARNR